VASTSGSRCLDLGSQKSSPSENSKAFQSDPINSNLIICCVSYG
jgi:hypothetical protein